MKKSFPVNVEMVGNVSNKLLIFVISKKLADKS